MNNGNNDKQKAEAAKPKEREFFFVGHSSNASVGRGIDLVNENKLLWPRQSHFLQNDCEPGFNGLKTTPKLRCTLAAIRRMYDKIDYRGYWLISEKMKIVLSETDPEAFAFAPCELVDFEGKPGPVRWLCDVVRVVDALDEGASDAKVERDRSHKRYKIIGSRRLVFRDELVGPAHIFRMEYMRMTIICDDFFRRACKSANLKVMHFGNTIDPRARARQYWVENCRKHLLELQTSQPQSRLIHRGIVLQQVTLADALLELGKHEQGIAELTEAVAIYNYILQSEPNYPYRKAVREKFDKATSLLCERGGSANLG